MTKPVSETWKSSNSNKKTIKMYNLMIKQGEGADPHTHNTAHAAPRRPYPVLQAPPWTPEYVIDNQLM
eukprot:2918441-Amphidinium_carterae.1